METIEDLLLCCVTTGETFTESQAKARPGWYIKNRLAMMSPGEDAALHDTGGALLCVFKINSSAFIQAQATALTGGSPASGDELVGPT